MVVALGPGKFYGSSLPRPRYYTSENQIERTDPPRPVLEPFLTWAQDAHWSMGGLSFKRHRLQGKIEGNVGRLRAQLEDTEKKRTDRRLQHQSKLLLAHEEEEEEVEVEVEEEEEEEEEEAAHVSPRPRKRRLCDEFDKVAASRSIRDSGKPRKAVEAVENRGSESKKIQIAEVETVASRTRSRRVEREEEGTKKGRGKLKLRKAKKSPSHL